MKTKLLVLDVLLAVAAVVLAVQVRDKLAEAQKREDVVLHRRVKPAAAPPFTPFPPVEPVAAVPYADIVHKNLFSPDRNPTVIVEVKAAPAPPKPMPPLPVFYGLMNLGDGPLAIMSDKPGEIERGVRIGAKLGEFTLLAATRDQVELEWDGKKITKSALELAPKMASSNEAAHQSSAPRGGGAPPTPPKSAPTPVAAGPGADVGGGYRACVAGDTTPVGTVMEGVKKISISTPMGSSCRWAPVQ